MSASGSGSFLRSVFLSLFLLPASLVLATETAAPDTTKAPVAAVAKDDAAGVRPPGSTWGVLPTAPGAQTPPAEEEKKRVEKKKTRRKNDGGDASGEEEDQDEDSSDCFGSCVGGFFGSLFSSGPEPEPAAPPPPASFQPAPQQTTAGPAYAPQPQPERVVTPADFSLVLVPSWWKSGPSEVWDEYKSGGGRIGVDAYFIPSENFEVGLGVGFAGATGTPLYDYVTSTRLDSPQKSHLWMVDTGVRAGMIHAFSRKGPFLRWGIGPRLFWVKETADLEVYELPGMVRLEDRKEALEQWRVGGDLAISMLWDTKSSVLLGFTVRMFVIPWNSSYEKSLTLDYIGKKSLVGFDIGLAVHFNGL